MNNNNHVCPRCGKVHNCPPVDPKKILDEHADALAKEIDKQVMEKMNVQKTSSDSRV